MWSMQLWTLAIGSDHSLPLDVSAATSTVTIVIIATTLLLQLQLITITSAAIIIIIATSSEPTPSSTPLQTYRFIELSLQVTPTTMLNISPLQSPPSSI